MKNKIIFCVFFAVVLHSSVQAQISEEIAKKYPPSVIYKLYAIASKTSLSTEKQVILAQYFLKQDSIASQALKNGSDARNVMNNYAVNEKYLKGVLSPLELNDYRFTNGNGTSQLIKAVKFREQLGLGPAQVDSLLKAVTELEALQKNDKPVPAANAFNFKTFEGEQLTKILKGSQYNNFLELLVKPKSQIENDDAWVLIKKYQLIKSADTGPIYDQTLKYFIKADIIDARVNNSKLSEKLDSVRKTYPSFKPVVLLKLDFINNKIPKSQFADVLKRKDELVLAEAQIDLLFENISKLEKLKNDFSLASPNARFDTRPAEVENLVKILTAAQYKKYLFFKNKNQSVINAKTDWDKLKTYGLNTGVDSSTVNRENENYELNKLVANELYHIESSPQNAQFKSKVESDKPIILKNLDIALKTTAANNNTKKSLAW